jgi:putative SOS response-associated peptidase YedK
MCYDISFQVNIKELIDYFPDLVFDSQMEMEFLPVSHIQGVGVFAPHPIIYMNKEDSKPHCRLMEWSVIEFFKKEEPDMKTRNGRLNIRSERILDDKSSYWYKIRNNRCIIPVSGAYDHRAIAAKGWKKKVPYHISPLNQKNFFLPALYSVAEIVDKTTGELQKRWTFGLITRPATEGHLMRNIHNDGENRWRMPLFLPFEMSKEFISSELDTNEKRYREILTHLMTNEELNYYTTDTIRTSKLREDGKQKHEPKEWAGLPALGLCNPEIVE